MEDPLSVARLDDTSRLIRELEAVERVATAASRHLDASLLCEVVGENLRDIFGTGIVYVALYDAESEMISIPYFLSSSGRVQIAPFRIGPGLTSIVIKRREPLLVQRDAGRRLRELGAFNLKPGESKSWLGVPIFAADEAVGMVSVQNLDQEDFFTDDDVRLLETIAGAVGVAVHNARLYETARRRANETAALAEISRELSSSLDLDEVLELIVEKARAMLTKDAVAIYLLEEGKPKLRARLARGPDSEAIIQEAVDFGTGIVGSVARSGKPEIVDDTAEDKRAEHVEGSAEDEKGEKLMAAPLVIRDRSIGVMSVWRGPNEPRFSSRDLDFLEAIARQAASAIHNARLYGRTREALAEAERASRLKSRFLGTLAREIRAPLAANSQLVKSLIDSGTQDPEALLKGVQSIAVTTSRLLDLADGAIDIAALEAGKLELEVEILDAAQALRDALAFVTPRAAARSCRLIPPKEGSEARVIADRRRLDWLLRELLVAAIAINNRVECGLAIRGGEVLISIGAPDTAKSGIRSDDGAELLGVALATRLLDLQGGRLEESAQARFVFALPSADFPPLDAQG